jgi:hypothetical protein
VGDALGNFHGEPPLSLDLLKILTLADLFGNCLDYSKYTPTKRW